MVSSNRRPARRLCGLAAFIVFLSPAISPPARAESKPDISEAPVPGKTLPPRPRPVETFKFEPKTLDLAVGEKLEYTIKWNGVPAGETRMEVKRRERLGDAEKGPEVYVVTCKTRSNPFVSTFYEVKDDVKSVIDVEGGFSRHFTMDKNEGSVRAEEKISFDYDPTKMVAAYEIRQGERARTKLVPVPDKCQDALSCLYYLRKVPLKLGGSARILVNTDKKCWDLTVKVVRRETMPVPGLGDGVQCLVVEPEAEFQGIFVRKGKMTVWLEETTHVPVRMDVDIPIGGAQAVLTGFANSPLNRTAETSPSDAKQD